jgi:hypothetical protein
VNTQGRYGEEIVVPLGEEFYLMLQVKERVVDRCCGEHKKLFLLAFADYIKKFAVTAAGPVAEMVRFVNDKAIRLPCDLLH